MPLTGKQIRHLRALGHHLNPVVLLGKNGLSEAVVAQLGEALERHELLKIKLLPECPIDRHDAGAEVATATSAELVQVLGKTLLFWKRNPQTARVELPKASAKKAKKAPVAEPPARGARPAVADDEDGDDDPYAELEEHDPPKVKHPHPRVIEDRAPAKRAVPSTRAGAPTRAGAATRPAERRAAPVRRGPHRGETPQPEEHAKHASPVKRGPYRGETPEEHAKHASPVKRGPYRGETPEEKSTKRPAPNKSDLTYNRPKGVRPGEKRPFSRDRSVPEERERRPFSRDRAPAGKAPVAREGQSAPRRSPPGGAKRGPKTPTR